LFGHCLVDYSVADFLLVGFSFLAMSVLCAVRFGSAKKKYKKRPG